VIVVDASALVDLLLRRPVALDGVERVLAGRAHEALHAPELIEPEMLNALRRLVQAGVIGVDHARGAVAALDVVRLIRHRHPPLRARVWSLRDALSAYDATYLALAEAHDAAVLLTADRGLAAVAERVIGAARVRHLA
jgi:predicted nucleic acid-binding protein